MDFLQAYISHDQTSHQSDQVAFLAYNVTAKKQINYKIKKWKDKPELFLLLILTSEAPLISTTDKIEWIILC